MSNNFIRVLRNGSLYADRAAAKTKLEEQLAKLQDGEICIASYGATWDAAKTILGVVRLKDGKRSYTIFDNEANSADILAKIQELDANETSTGDSHVTVNVVEVDGVITKVNVTTSDIASAKSLGTKGDAAGTDTAFGRIAQEVADRAQAITDAIAALDSTVAATASVDKKVYSVLTGVTQEDGKLKGKTEVTLAAVAKTGKAEDVATTAIAGDTTHVAVAGTTVSGQISSIATTLKNVEKSIAEAKANDLKYRTVKLSDAEVTELKDSNVKEAYKVVSYTGTWESATDKATVGDVIKIYKDSSVKEIYLGSANDSINKTTGDITRAETVAEADLSLNYAYMNADGTYGMAKINVANFLRESEFGNGLQVNNGIVSVKKAEGSESFLTVDGNGVKISGVQNAITTAIQALDIEKTGTSEDGKVSVTVTEADGKISGVTVTTPGLALNSEVVKAVTVNGVNATVTSNKADVTIKGGNIAVADSYETTVYPEKFDAKVGEDNHIKAADKINDALKKTENTISVLATEVISNEKVTTAAVSKLAESAGVLGEGGVIDYVPDTSTTYIKTATSVHDATVKLDAAIKTVEGNANNALTEVQGSNAITVSTKAEKKQTVSLKLDTTKDGNGDGATPKPAGANALTVTDNGLYLSNVWDCGEY